MIQRHIPQLVVLELTRRCSLNCIYCRASAETDIYNNELTTKECFRVLDEIVSFAKPIIILSGGEPLFRKDVFDIIKYGSNIGLTVVLATCGILVTGDIAKKLKASGVKRISISVDGKDAQTHDGIRGEKGVFDKAVSAMQILKSEGIEFQINTTVTCRNVNQLEDILELAKKYGAVGFHPFFLVPVGRAKCLSSEELSPYQYERVLNWLYEESKMSSITIKPTCAPHYSRIAMSSQAGGCLGGKSFAFISSTGLVQICGFLEVVCGNIRKNSFVKIWRESPVFNHLRDTTQYKGKCGGCEYLRICGGCRARAYIATGDYLEEEPNCVYQPVRLATLAQARQ